MPLPGEKGARRSRGPKFLNSSQRSFCTGRQRKAADIALRRITLTAEQWERASHLVLFWTRHARSRTVRQPDATLAQLKGVKAGLSEQRKGAQPAAGRTEEIERLQEELRRTIERRRPDVRIPPEPGKTGVAGEPTPAEPQPDSTFSPYTRRLLEAKKRARNRQSSPAKRHDPE